MSVPNKNMSGIISSYILINTMYSCSANYVFFFFFFKVCFIEILTNTTEHRKYYETVLQNDSFAPMVYNAVHTSCPWAWNKNINNKETRYFTQKVTVTRS